MNLDATDRKILRILQQDARISNLDLAAKINLSPTPCARRVRRLEEMGCITGSTVLLDPEVLGLNLTSYLAVAMERHTNEQFEKFESQVVKFPEVVGCSVVTGRSEDYLLKVVARNMKHYEEFLLGRLSRLPGVTNLHSSFELRNVIPNKGLPVDL
ncbi:MAG: Lrp/AsnC family transcriptional regulator [Gammaproteobacteria bacterium]|nr:Lrp/AsnC family transcriptional regulator [Gammaproteobacteria bacterium]MDE0281162.1 Lrp/AsnC family transcriptional regulator [Gammaproteobacteria bacterium]